MGDEKSVEKEGDELFTVLQRKERACPVPKPRGALGEVLGFKSEKREGKGMVDASVVAKGKKSGGEER